MRPDAAGARGDGPNQRAFDTQEILMPPQTPLGLACALALAAGSAMSAPPAVTDLGTGTLPQAVSDNGEVIVGFSFHEEVPENSGIFRWTPGGGLSIISPGVLGGRPGVSADGRVIGGTVVTDRAEAAFWTEDKWWTPLSETGFIPALPGWETVTHAISGNGERLAGGTTPPPIDFGWVRAFSFNPDTEGFADFGWQELPKARKGSIANATAISNDGTVQAGISSDIAGRFRAVRWVDGHIEEIFDLNGERLGGESVACNEDCSVMVGGGGGSSAVNPILAWRLLPEARPAACYFEPMDSSLAALRHYAYDTNEAGSVVVGAYYYDVIDPPFIRNVAKGFLWLGDARGGTLVDFQEYVAMLGEAYFSDWQEIVPVAVSGNGRHLVGWGVDGAETLRGWKIDFGTIPVAGAALPPSARYTRCPQNPPAPGREVAAKTTQWELPEGEFQAADGSRYFVESRGVTLYGGPHGDPQQPLLSLGGRHYLDPESGARLYFVRDREGRVTELQAQDDNELQRWQRTGD
jgi:uncharacterized membrane protein